MQTGNHRGLDQIGVCKGGEKWLNSGDIFLTDPQDLLMDQIWGMRDQETEKGSSSLA